MDPEILKLRFPTSYIPERILVANSSLVQSPLTFLALWVVVTSAWSLLTLLCYVLYRPKPVPKSPTYHASRDVTIVVATIDAEDTFKDAIATWRAGSPKEIIIVTVDSAYASLQQMARSIDRDQQLIRVLRAPRANKRVQLATGIREVRTQLVVTADDDVFWPPGLLPRLLACFEDAGLGGATVAGGVTPLAASLTPWEILGDLRMTALGVVRCASSTVDGGITALSGRTSAFRTALLNDPKVLDGFINERWMGKYPISSADGCALTESIVGRGWKTYMQKCPETELLTTVKNDWTWLLQVVRWSRDHWRQNLRALFVHPQKTWKYPFTAMGRVRDTLQPFSTLLKCGLIVAIARHRRQEGTAQSTPYEMAYLAALLLFSQIPQMLTLLPHFRKRPQHVLYLPAWCLFCYFRGFISLYALFTLHVTAWGTRKVAEAPAQKSVPAHEKHHARSKTRSAAFLDHMPSSIMLESAD